MKCPLPSWGTFSGVYDRAALLHLIVKGREVERSEVWAETQSIRKPQRKTITKNLRRSQTTRTWGEFNQCPCVLAITKSGNMVCFTSIMSCAVCGLAPFYWKTMLSTSNWAFSGCRNWVIIRRTITTHWWFVVSGFHPRRSVCPMTSSTWSASVAKSDEDFPRLKWSTFVCSQNHIHSSNHASSVKTFFFNIGGSIKASVVVWDFNL